MDAVQPPGLTAERALANLDQKLSDPTFRRDLDPLVAEWPVGYDLHAAASLIKERLLSKLSS